MSLPALIDAERNAGLPRLAGSYVSGVIPVREDLIDEILAAWRPPSAIEDLRLRLLPDNRIAIRAMVRLLGFRKTIELTLRVAPALEPGPPRRLYLFHAGRSLLSNVLGLAGPVLPSWLAANESGFVVDIDALAARTGFGDIVRHLGPVAFNGQAGVLWVNFEAHGTPGPAREGRTAADASGGRSGPARHLDAAQMIRLFEGARLRVRLRVAESLVNEVLDALAADAGTAAEGRGGPGGPAVDWRALIRLPEAPRVRFEPQAAVVEAALEIPVADGQTAFAAPPAAE